MQSYCQGHSENISSELLCMSFCAELALSKKALVHTTQGGCVYVEGE